MTKKPGTQSKTDFKAIPKLPENFPMTFKEIQSDKVCGKHYQMIRKELAKLPHVSEEKEGEIPVAPEPKVQNPADLSAAQEPLTPQPTQLTQEPTQVVQKPEAQDLVVNKDVVRDGSTSPKRKGRLVYSPAHRFKLAATALKGASLSKAGEVVAIGMASSIEDISQGLDVPSRQTAIQALCELYQCFKFHQAHLFSESKLVMPLPWTPPQIHIESSLLYISLDSWNFRKHGGILEGSLRFKATRQPIKLTL